MYNKCVKLHKNIIEEKISVKKLLTLFIAV
jgi:hypothetical protein